jgi:hypothetical protein
MKVSWRNWREVRHSCEKDCLLHLFPIDEHLDRPNAATLEDMLHRIDTVYHDVKTTLDSTLDARVLQALTNLGIRKIQELDASLSSTFNLAAVMEGLSSCFDRTNDARTSIHREEPLPVHRWWYQYTREVCVADFLNGPIVAEAKTRRMPVMRTRKDVAQESRPEQVKIVSHNDPFDGLCR